MITEAPAKPDTFVPLLPAVSPAKEAAFSALNVKVLPQAATKSVFESLKAAPEEKQHSTENCAKPTVTVQRNGDVVTSIRIQCGCGQVIDLNCLY